MNPCDLCEKKNKRSHCRGCVLDEHDTMCSTYDCMNNYEGACLMGFGKVCGASSEFEDGWHTCDECIHITEIDGEFRCVLHKEEVGEADDACDDFEEDYS